MRLINWTDINLVVKTIIEERVDLLLLKTDDVYLIEKITDTVFEKVRKKELSNEGITKESNN